jgi:two-component system sensor histidine kinase RegB
MPRIGEPYVRGRRAQRGPAAADEAGLGLGFFIAKTLLQRSGARISVSNNPAPATGATIRISWHRKDFEVPAGNLKSAPLSPGADQHTYHFM